MRRNFRSLATRFAFVLGLSVAAAHARGQDAATADFLTPPSQLLDVESTLLTADQQAADNEIVRERYPNRNIKVERQVAQDADGNYVNHGSWAMWDDQGRLLGRGEYQYGKRHGAWVRFFKAGEAPMLSGTLGRQFQAPFIAAVTFADDALHGTWTITDAQDREVVSLSFDNGKRHGKSVWWYPNGQKWREVSYMHGEVDGEFIEWTPDGAIVAQETYQDGRRYGSQVEWYSPGVRKIEGNFLFAREVVKNTDVFWNGVSDTKLVGQEGTDVKDGRWTTWFRNGQKAMEGEYHNDQPHGLFTWWHPNGQKAIQGAYVDGKQDGTWRWWYDDGQKQILGEYALGEQSGSWTWWNDAGELVESTQGGLETPKSGQMPKPDPIASEPQPLASEPSRPIAVEEKHTPAPTAATKPSQRKNQPTMAGPRPPILAPKQPPQTAQQPKLAPERK